MKNSKYKRPYDRKKLIIHNNAYAWGQSIVLIREDGLAVIRLSIGKDEPEVAYLTGLSVQEEHRRKGLGSKMLFHALEIAREHGLKYARLDAEKGSFVFDWYIGKGFRYYGDKPDENDFVPMYKTL